MLVSLRHQIATDTFIFNSAKGVRDYGLASHSLLESLDFNFLCLEGTLEDSVATLTREVKLLFGIASV